MPSSGSCGASTRGVIFNFGYLGTNKKQSADPDPSCHKYPIPDDTPLPFGHRKIMPDQGNAPPITPRSLRAGPTPEPSSRSSAASRDPLTASALRLEA